MDLIGIGGVGLIILFFGIMTLPLTVLFLQWYFSPLPAIGKKSGDWVLISLMALLCAGHIGLILILIVYLIHLVQERLKKNRDAKAVGQALPEERRAPFFRFALSDLLAMVLAIGFSPLAAAWFLSIGFNRGSLVTLFITAALILPILYTRGLSRVNTSSVPFGTERSLFLFLYPYLIFCGFYVGVVMALFLSMALLSMLSRGQHGGVKSFVDFGFYLHFAGGVIVLVLGRQIVFAAQKAAYEHKRVQKQA